PRRYGGTSGMALLFHGTGRTRHRVGSCGDVSRSGPPATVFRYGVLRYPAMARNGDAWNVRSIFASQAERLPHLPATCRQERRPAEFPAFGREPSDARFALGTMPAAKYAYPDRYGRFTSPPVPVGHVTGEASHGLPVLDRGAGVAGRGRRSCHHPRAGRTGALDSVRVWDRVRRACRRPVGRLALTSRDPGDLQVEERYRPQRAAGPRAAQDRPALRRAADGRRDELRADGCRHPA